LNKSLGVSEKVNGPDLKIDTKRESDRQTGFIAQEVEAAVKKTGLTFSGVVAPQNDKDHYGLRYGDFVVPLVKAVQELSSKVEEQQRTIEALANQLNKTRQTGNGTLAQSGIELFQNSPNPTSSATEIKMTLPEGIMQADLIVYDMQGIQLKSIRVLDRGATTVRILGNELAAGMYFYTLVADSQVIDTKRMILTR